MPYIGNVLTSFAVETGNITDQAVTTPKLSATGGTEGQVLGLDAGGNLVWTSDPAGQWVTSGNDIFYTTGNVGIGVSSPGQALDVADVDIAPLRVTRDQAVSSGAGLVLRQPNTTDGNDLRIVYQTDTTGTGASSDVFFAALEFTAATHDHDTRAGEIGFFTAQGGTGFVDRMRIRSDGTVRIGGSTLAGIGTKVQVHDGADNRNILGVTGADVSSEYIALGIISGDPTITAGNAGAGNTALRFDVASSGTESEAMRIDSSGRLLVGTTTDQSISSDTNALVQIFTQAAGKLLLGREDSEVVADNFIGIIDFHSTDGGSERCARIACQAEEIHGTGTKASRLSFLTSPSGSATPVERLRINSAGNIGLGNAVDANTKLELSASNAGATQNNVLRFTDTDTSFQAGQSPGRIEWNTSDADSAGTTVFLDTFGYTNAVSDLQIGTGAGGSATERMRVRHDGIVLIGTTTTVDSTSKLQIVNDDFPGDIALGRNDTTVSGNALGRILFYGNDDNGTYELGAFIVAQADGDHATGDKPTLITFGTAPDGTASAVERLRINPNGMVELRANQGSAQTNIIRFTDTDTSVAGDQVLGQLQWFSSDVSGGGACVKAEIAAVCDDTTPDVRLEIKTHSGSGTDPIESVRITSTGNIQLRRSGTGIDFAASQGAPDAGTSTSEVLDSYEEGTWTPSINGLSNSPSFSNLTGRYTRIGRLVVLKMLIQPSTNPTFTTTSDGFAVSGVPFSEGNNNAAYFGGQGGVRTHSLDFTNSAHNSAGATANWLTAAVSGSNVVLMANINDSAWGEIRNQMFHNKTWILELTISYFTDA